MAQCVSDRQARDLLICWIQTNNPSFVHPLQCFFLFSHGLAMLHFEFSPLKSFSRVFMAPDQALGILHFRFLLISYLLSPQYPTSRVPSLLCSVGVCFVVSVLAYEQNLFHLTVRWMGVPVLLIFKNKKITAGGTRIEPVDIKITCLSRLKTQQVMWKNCTLEEFISVILSHPQANWLSHTQHDHWLGFMSSLTRVHWHPYLLQYDDLAPYCCFHFLCPNFPFLLLVTPLQHSVLQKLAWSHMSLWHHNTWYITIRYRGLHIRCH